MDVYRYLWSQLCMNGFIMICSLIFLLEVLAPRVRPEAQEIAKMHTMGTIAMLLKSQPHSQVSKHTPRRKNTTTVALYLHVYSII